MRMRGVSIRRERGRVNVFAMLFIYFLVLALLIRIIWVSCDVSFTKVPPPRRTTVRRGAAGVDGGARPPPPAAGEARPPPGRGCVRSGDASSGAR